MEFRLTTNCKSIDAEFVCDRLQKTLWLDDTNNNLETMHETTAENESRRTETGSSLVSTTTTTTTRTPDNSQTPKFTLAPRKRSSNGPCEKLFE